MPPLRGRVLPAGLCLECPSRGLTVINVIYVVITYGGICLLWLVFNRLFTEESAFMDSILNFAQITGTLGDFSLNWPGKPLPTSCIQILCPMHPTCYCIHEEAGWGTD